MALTTYNSNGSNINSTRNYAYVDPANGDIFIADTYLAGTSGCQVWKYNVRGDLITTATLDSTPSVANLVQMVALSNGNLCVMWTNNASPSKLFFQILDKTLLTVVAKTEIDTAGVNPLPNSHIIALSGGGFAVAYCRAGFNSRFTIRDNAGNVVKAPTDIAGMATPSSGTAAGPRFRLAQLSNGNIAVAVNETTSSNNLQFCIYDTAGNVIVGYTSLTGGVGAISVYPDIAVMNGYFCIAVTGSRAYVVNNAGTVQGSAINLTTYNPSSAFSVLSDGTYFWIGLTRISGGFFTLIRISSGGVEYTLTQINASGVTIDVQARKAAILAGQLN
ncbi:hypothetical protein [Nitrosomonas oligotropha]|uniref:hypothetical protein n=1 Tax=Nitrosomonas oligotropha TaxID=42354 RepID=UPI0013712E8F|nr:hypothetical protein [Nitrosomonas oligotropha]MXS83969.1 hypothetical protein [Nitrosomonas oligotropha]